MPDQELSQYLAYLSRHPPIGGCAWSKLDRSTTRISQRSIGAFWSVLRRRAGPLHGRTGRAGTAQRAGTDKNIDKLVTRGLVQRATDPHDSRKVLVFISDFGLKTAARLKARVDAHHDSIEELLGPQKTTGNSNGCSGISSDTSAATIQPAVATQPTLAQLRHERHHGD